jgi:signal transduction histidine kinase
MNKFSLLRRYGLPVIACGIALSVARSLRAESSSFVLAIIVSSLFAGRGPGLFAVGLSAIAFGLSVLPSRFSLLTSPSSYLRFAVFLVVAFTASELIESKRRSEEALRKSQAQLSRATRFATVAELAAAIAHEISQPLSAVVANGLACMQWLSAEPPNVHNGKVAAERIVRDGKDAGEIVSRIRALFRKTTPEKVNLNINGVIDEVLRLIQKEAVEKQTTIETDLEKRLPPVPGDRVQLQQVIFNLLLNGIEAMETVTDRPKRLLIRSKVENADSILVEIRDYGTGLADSERIFEAFYTTKEKGMGMGLSICRSIVEAHGGSLSTAPSQGPGTTFIFTLPLASKASV